MQRGEEDVIARDSLVWHAVAAAPLTLDLEALFD